MDRRTRNRARTRKALHEASVSLVASRGFAGATVAAIADAADVSPRTFFGYFPTKEAALFHPYEPVIEGLETMLATRDRPPALEVLRRWAVDVLPEADVSPELDALLERLVDEQGEVAGHVLRLVGRVERALAVAFAVDLGVSRDDPRPKIVAAATTAVLQRPELLSDVDATRLAADLDLALAFVHGGLQAIRSSSAGAGRSGPG